MTLADIARGSVQSRSGPARAAAGSWRSIPGADEAPPATWTLANLLDQAGDKVGAAEAYALYRRLSPTGDFAEDAAAREVDIALSQGNVERAAALLEEYARNFPKSKRITSLKKELRGPAAPPASPVGGEKPAPLEPTTKTTVDEPSTSRPPSRRLTDFRALLRLALAALVRRAACFATRDGARRPARS